MNSAFDRPILVTGCARSRTSMVAGALDKCGLWGGDMFGAAPGNQTGFFENKAIRENVVKPMLRMMGVDPLGVFPLPPYPDGDEWRDDLYEAIKTMVDDQGYMGERWFYKGAKMAYLWPAFHAAFPNAQWIIVRRDREEIIDSCLRTHFMKQHSEERSFWEEWVDETENRLKDLKASGADYVEVWPPDGLRDAVESLGVEWTDEAEQFVADPYRPAENMTHVSTANPVPDAQIQSNIRTNIQRAVPRVHEGLPRNDTLIIAGGGPSLKDNLPALRKANGRILAINGVHDFLVERGIKPWGMMMIDPREDMGKFASRPREGVRYFLASQLDPQVFDRLEGYDIHMWHAYVEAGERDVLEEFEDDWTMIAGGSTCGLRAMHLGLFLGFRRIHCFGMDSCLHGNDHHAYEQDIRSSGLERVMKVTAAGREFMATGWMYAQAQDFNALLTHHGHKFKVKFTGGGLLAHVADEHPNRR